MLPDAGGRYKRAASKLIFDDQKVNLKGVRDLRGAKKDSLEAMLKRYLGKK